MICVTKESHHTITANGVEHLTRKDYFNGSIFSFRLPWISGKYNDHPL